MRDYSGFINETQEPSPCFIRTQNGQLHMNTVGQILFLIILVGLGAVR
jgi:hypothetical protein